MGQHRGKPGYGPRSTAMRHLTVYLFSHRLFLEKDDYSTRQFRYRRYINIDDTLCPKTRRRDINAIFVDRHLTGANLIDQR